MLETVASAITALKDREEVPLRVIQSFKLELKFQKNNFGVLQKFFSGIGFSSFISRILSLKIKVRTSRDAALIPC